MAQIPIGLQLYSVRDDCKQDLPATLKAVAGMGYAGVEFAGYYGYSASDLRKILDDLGIVCCGTHTGLDTLLGDALGATVEYNQILGNNFLIVPGLSKERTESKSAWLQTAQMMNGISEQLKPHGMKTGYHNHYTEFQPLDASGELPWDMFFGSTNPEVIMQFDTGNAGHAHAEAGPYLRHYPHRALTVHLKEYSATDDKALIGEGDVKWPEIFDLCETIGGTQWYVVEQESYAYPPLECVDKCLQTLRAMGK